MIWEVFALGSSTSTSLFAGSCSGAAGVCWDSCREPLSAKALGHLSLLMAGDARLRDGL